LRSHPGDSGKARRKRVELADHAEQIAGIEVEPVPAAEELIVERRHDDDPHA
jgi:hypothetical protein